MGHTQPTRRYSWLKWVLPSLPRIQYITSGAEVKKSPAKAGDVGDMGLIPGLRRSPGEGNGSPLQYLCLGNPMKRGAWGHKEKDTTEQPSMHALRNRFPSNPVYKRIGT